MNGYSKYLYLSNHINPNSKMEVMNFESIQIEMLLFIHKTYSQGEEEKARKLMSMFNKHRKHYGQTFSNEEVENYYRQINELFVKR